jgi:hypothetical protein
LARKPPDERAADLLNVLAAVLLPIARVMIRRELGAGALVLAAKLSYLRAAIDEVVPQGGRANVSRLSVVTGMTRKEVASLLSGARIRESTKPQSKPMEQRALKVLRGWATNPLFQSRAGKSAELDLRGDGRTFSSLVRIYGGDVTPASVLRELERMNAVTTSHSGRKLRLRRRSLRSTARSREQIAEFGYLLRDFVDTTSQVVTPADPPRYFGFRDSFVSTPAQAALFQRTFSRRAALLLESVEQWWDRQVGPSLRKQLRRNRPATRVGLGIYLVQQLDSRSDKRQSRAPRRAP